jgi:hypothetical protein
MSQAIANIEDRVTEAHVRCFLSSASLETPVIDTHLASLIAFAVVNVDPSGLVDNLLQFAKRTVIAGRDHLFFGKHLTLRVELSNTVWIHNIFFQVDGNKSETPRLIENAAGSRALLLPRSSAHLAESAPQQLPFQREYATRT